jgi:hypothetical protein
LLPGDHRVLEGLARIGYDFAREWTAKELLARPITVIGDEPAVDVFTVAWTVNYEQAVRRAASAEVEGVIIPFIGLDDLLATERTGRLQDAADVEVPHLWLAYASMGASLVGRMLKATPSVIFSSVPRTTFPDRVFSRHAFK